MSATLQRIRELTAAGHIKVSDHGDDELTNDGLTVTEIIEGVEAAELVEDYSRVGKSPCVLLLQRRSLNEPIHAYRAIAKGPDRPAALITAFRADPAKWSDECTVTKQ